MVVFIKKQTLFVTHSVDGVQCLTLTDVNVACEDHCTMAKIINTVGSTTFI